MPNYQTAQCRPATAVRDCDTLGFVSSLGVGMLVLTLLLVIGNAYGAQDETLPWAEIGRPATPDEIKAWDIDVGADFKGLPAGAGSVDEGEVIWEAQCESCHGTFAESGHVFTPIVGGITAEDIERGRVANLNSGTYPHRTTLMKLSKISTLWDYINRAMPWNAPKSLTPNEVYAVAAYILYLGEIVPDDFVFSNKNIAKVQEMLPNRNGMVTYEPMWNVDGKPDVQGDACMQNCKTELEIRSFLPDYARDAHGNLADQNRLIGATRGAVTNQPKTKSLQETRDIAKQIKAPGAAVTSDPSLQESGESASAKKPAQIDTGAQSLASQSNCLACHGINNKVVGPALSDIAKRYADQDGALDLLSSRVRQGASGTWGPVPMPANPGVSEADARRLVRWILTLQN